MFVLCEIDAFMDAARWMQSNNLQREMNDVKCKNGKITKCYYRTFGKNRITSQFVPILPIIFMIIILCII